jgi:hypothetical protein
MAAVVAELAVEQRLRAVADRRSNFQARTTQHGPGSLRGEPLLRMGPFHFQLLKS